MTRLLILLLAICALTVAAQAEIGQMRPRPFAQALNAARDDRWAQADRLAARDVPVARDIINWMRLRAGAGSYDEVQRFLARHPDWPGLALLRKRSEGAVVAQGRQQVSAFFAQAPARTAQGVLSHAAALRATGQEDDARRIVIDAWRNWRLSDSEQSLFLAAEGDTLADQHSERLDYLIWRGWFTEARRMLPLVSKDWQALARARMALRNQSKSVDTLLAKVPNALQNHPGLIHDRFEWRARKGRWDEAKKMLLAQSRSADLLGRPDRWAHRRRVLARDELRDGAARRAYDLASRHHLDSGSAYADLEWLSGYIAMTRLNDPQTALRHFENHDSAVASPISQGRAGYWKGRALMAMGETARADMEFTMGAQYQTSFYGLLAAEAAGLPFDVGLADVPTDPWQNSPLVQDSLFQAGELLIAAGQRSMAEQFWTHLAEQLGEHDAALMGQAAIDLGEPHLAVMIGKAVARRGAIVPLPYYALHPLAKAGFDMAPEMSLAIARRESEFDPVVKSGVGARGLMQLMPGTALDVARDLGLGDGHSNGRLTSDPLYNARLGTTYLADLAARFEGNVVMMSAGYNAGPARPDRWMRDYGDPRGKGLDAMIDWIEGIPFRETRNYVMRVTESLPIYRARLGKDPLPVPFSQELQGATLRGFATN